MTPRTAYAAPPSVSGTADSKTFRLREDTGRVFGVLDGIEAVRQSVRQMLSVERYEWLIHSWNYGVELSDLFGKPLPFVLPELERRITEALCQDDRITAVRDFSFDTGRRGRVTASFTVETIYGALGEETEVSI